MRKLTRKLLRLPGKLLASRWRSTKRSWASAWREPVRGLRFIYLALGLSIAYLLVPFVFDRLGAIGAVSYLVCVIFAMLNATFFRVVRLRRKVYAPLGLVAPVAILLGVYGAAAIRPMLGEAKDSALAQDFAGAVVILAVFLLMWLVFRRWQSGTLY